MFPDLKFHVLLSVRWMEWNDGSILRSRKDSRENKTVKKNNHKWTQRIADRKRPERQDGSWYMRNFIRLDWSIIMIKRERNSTWEQLQNVNKTESRVLHQQLNGYIYQGEELQNMGKEKYELLFKANLWVHRVGLMGVSWLKLTVPSSTEEDRWHNYSR